MLIEKGNRRLEGRINPAMEKDWERGRYGMERRRMDKGGRNGGTRPRDAGNEGRRDGKEKQRLKIIWIKGGKGEEGKIGLRTEGVGDERSDGRHACTEGGMNADMTKLRPYQGRRGLEGIRGRFRRGWRLANTEIGD